MTLFQKEMILIPEKMINRMTGKTKRLVKTMIYFGLELSGLSPVKLPLQKKIVTDP